MLPTRNGSIRLFRFSGITVFLHWSWFMVAAFEINNRANDYSSIAWNALEYLSLFVIVTLHEFGHALACRQVGGQANQIVLWPLGGVAFVSPPPRPGATLWSIAAGPLVNVILLPILGGLFWLARSSGWEQSHPDAFGYIQSIALINAVILAFNLLPIFPLDGGQILQSLLWFVFGRARSLLVATVLGFVGVVGLIGVALWMQSVWTAVVCAFLGFQCWRGFKVARTLARIDSAPRREGLACPACHQAPAIGTFWVCGGCRTSFDTFETGARCPQCGATFPTTMCTHCGKLFPMDAWTSVTVTPPPVPTSDKS